MMKKLLLFLVPLLAGLLLTLSFSSCEQFVLPGISLNPDTLRFTASGGVLPVEVEANVKWTLTVPTEASSWLTAGETAGSGNLTVGFEATANTDDERKATITFTSETLRKRLTVIQAAGL